METIKDAMSVLKKISTGELIDSDVKYGARVQGRPHLVPILDANIAFDYGDDSYGRRRRVIKLDFPYTFGDAQGQRHIDRNLEEKLIRPEVLSGIARIIAARARYLVASKRIFRRKNSDEMDEEFRRQRFSFHYFCIDCLSQTWPFDEKPERLRVDSAYKEYLEYCKLFNVTTPYEIGPFGSRIHEKFGVQSTNTSTASDGHRADYRYYPALYQVKSAKAAYAETKLKYDNPDRNTSGLLQEWLGKNAICMDNTTGTTEELLAKVVEEIERMYVFISACKDEKHITYENYLQNPVVFVGSVVKGQEIMDSNTIDKKTPDVGQDNAVGEHVDEGPILGSHLEMELPTPKCRQSSLKEEDKCPVCGTDISPGHSSSSFDGVNYCMNCTTHLSMIRASVKAQTKKNGVGPTTTEIFEDVSLQSCRPPLKERNLPAMLRCLGFLEIDGTWVLPSPPNPLGNKETDNLRPEDMAAHPDQAQNEHACPEQSAEKVLDSDLINMKRKKNPHNSGSTSGLKAELQQADEREKEWEEHFKTPPRRGS